MMPLQIRKKNINNFSFSFTLISSFFLTISERLEPLTEKKREGNKANKFLAFFFSLVHTLINATINNEEYT